MGKQKITIPSGYTQTVKCIIHSGIEKGNQFALFVPADIPRWDKGLEVHETLVALNRSSTCMEQIPVSNTTGHPITLTQGVHLGYVTQIKSVISMKPLRLCRGGGREHV